MASRRTYKVTATHIAQGKRGSASNCPVALAIREQDTPVYATVCATWARAWTGGDAVLLRARMPDDASTWVYAFDRGEHVAPFALTLSWKPE